MQATVSGVVSGIQSGDAVTKIEIAWCSGAETADQAMAAGRGVILTAAGDIAAYQAGGYALSSANMVSGQTYTGAVRVTESRSGVDGFAGVWTSSSAFTVSATSYVANFDLTAAEPPGTVYVQNGSVDTYPTGNATACGTRFHFDFAGWQTGKSSTVITYEFQGLDNNNDTYASAQYHRYALKILPKPYTEIGAYPSASDTPLYRVVIDPCSDRSSVLVGSYYFAAGLTSFVAPAINLTHRFRVTVTIDQVAHTMSLVLYDVTTSTQVYATTPVSMTQNLAAMSTVQPGTAIFEGFDLSAAGTGPLIPSYSPGNGVYMQQRANSLNLHYGYWKKFTVSQA